MKALVIYPTVFEAAAFFKARAAGRPSVGAVVRGENGAVSALVSGYGCAASMERVRRAAEDLKPDIALLCGFCGSCSPEFSRGDFLYETSNPELRGIFESLGASPARIATSAAFAGRAEKQRLFRAGFAAVDMEAAVFSGCFPEGRFGSFRCVSDDLNPEVPEDFFRMMIDTDTGMEKSAPLAAFRLLLKNPRGFARLVRYALSSRGMMAGYSEKSLALAEKLAAFGPVQDGAGNR